MKKILIFLIAMTFTAPVYAIDGNELLKKIDRNLNPESFEMYRKIINQEPDGSKKEFIMYSAKKGKDKVVSLFLAPASEKGPIRITSLQSVTGGIFNNADIMRIDYSTEYNCENVEQAEGKYILDLKAKTKAVAYDKVKMWVDDKKLLPGKIECYASSGMLIKTLYFKEIKDFGDGIVRPAVTETDSPLHRGYKSIMIFAKLKKRDLADEVFTLNYMSRVGDLR